MKRDESKQWFRDDTENGVLVLSIKLSEEAEVFDTHEGVASEVVDVYRSQSANLGNPSCVVVIETKDAPSPLLRILFELYEACRKKGGSLYVCNFPDEYTISLNTLGLTEYPGFILRPNKQVAIKEASLTKPKES